GPARLSDTFPARHGVRAGGAVAIDGPDGRVELEVIGPLQDYTWNRGTLIVNRAWYARTFKDDQIDLFDVWLRPGEDRAAVADSLREQDWARGNVLVIATREEAQ